jgi:hypothetical protein
MIFSSGLPASNRQGPRKFQETEPASRLAIAEPEQGVHHHGRVEPRPDPAGLGAMLRPRKPLSLIFADDGIIPNNPRFPVIIYRGAVKVSSNRDEWLGPLLARHCL